MALTSSSTVDDARAQFRDNAGWLASGSVTMANAFREALLFLLDSDPISGSIAGGTFSRATLEKELDRVTAFISGKSSAARVGPIVTRMVPSQRFRG